MLTELRIENLGVIQKIELRLGSGLTVISGEEGAGKSLLVDALSLLVGRRPGDVIRSGAALARVEGVFWLENEVMERVGVRLRESGMEPDPEGTLILSRELRRGGRSLAWVNGRPAPVSLLQQIGELVIDLHQQMEHLSLLEERRQLHLLDNFGGLAKLRAHLANKVDELKGKALELKVSRAGESGRDRELLRYQVEEIEGANLVAGEEEVLQQERDVLHNAQALKEGCLKAFNSLYAGEGSATEMVQQAVTELRVLGIADPVLAGQQEALEENIAVLEDIARELRRYGEAVEARSGRLEEVEQRLELLTILKRKHERNIEELITFAADARTQLEALENEEERRALLEAERQRLEEEAGRVAEKLSQARRQAAGPLAELVNQELMGLGLHDARFDIALSGEEHPEGLSTSDGKRFAYSREGIDRVEFLVTTNPGEPAKPLGRVASGGETCRLMLALKSALKCAEPVPTLIFDEIDIGVGGRSAGIVGRKLADLARHHQVLCITHLPQIACFGDTHCRVVKDIVSERAATKVEVLERRSRLEELAAMLGGQQAGEIMLEGADQLLTGADAWRSREKEVLAV